MNNKISVVNTVSTDWSAERFKEVTIEVDGQVHSSGKLSNSSRNVFLFEDFVLKFESCDQNAKELYFYQNTLEEEDAHFFPKLLGHGKHNGEVFLLQERVFESENRKPTKEDKAEFDKVVSKYEIGDLCMNLYGDGTFYMCNCMMTDDGVKIYDIGIQY